MNHRKYQVELAGYITTVRAFNEQAAIILAQAEAIKNARDYSFVKITEL